MLASHDYLLELNLGWNSLRGKGGAALAEGLKGNTVLNKVDIGWNGLGDEGARAVGEMLSNNVALTHLDVSHNRINLEGALALAEGIKNNNALMSLELGFNPMGVRAGIAPAAEEGAAVRGGIQHHLAGVREVVEALKQNQNIESVGLTNVQSGGAYSRGRASRFDPKNPDGHYILDLAQPWDHFLVETLHERMAAEVGESWVNVTLAGQPLELPCLVRVAGQRLFAQHMLAGGKGGHRLRYVLLVGGGDVDRGDPGVFQKRLEIGKGMRDAVAGRKILTARPQW